MWNPTWLPLPRTKSFQLSKLRARAREGSSDPVPLLGGLIKRASFVLARDYSGGLSVRLEPFITTRSTSILIQAALLSDSRFDISYGDPMARVPSSTCTSYTVAVSVSSLESR